MTEPERVQADALREIRSKRRLSRTWVGDDPLTRYLGALDYAEHRRDEGHPPGPAETRHTEQT